MKWSSTAIFIGLLAALQATPRPALALQVLPEEANPANVVFRHVGDPAEICRTLPTARPENAAFVTYAPASPPSTAWVELLHEAPPRLRSVSPPVRDEIFCDTRSLSTTAPDPSLSDPSRVHSSAVLRLPANALETSTPYTLLFDASLIVPAGTTPPAPALGKPAILQLLMSYWGATWLANSSDRFYVTETPTTFRMPVHPNRGFLPAQPNGRFTVRITLSRWASDRPEAHVRIENLRIVRGLPVSSSTPRTAFAGARVRLDADGNWEVNDAPAGDPPSFRPFFPISIAAGSGDAQLIGRRRRDLGEVVASPAPGQSEEAFNREKGFEWFRQAGFNVMKGFGGAAGFATVQEAYSQGIHSLMGLSTAFKTGDVSFPSQPASASELSALDSSLFQLPPSWSHYPPGLLAWWMDFEDHAWFGEFDGFQSIRDQIRARELQYEGGDAFPILINRGVTGGTPFLGRYASGTATYHNQELEGGREILTSGKSSLLGAEGQTLPWAIAVRSLPLADPASLNLTRNKALMWDAIAAGAKGLHFFSFSQDLNGSFCGTADSTTYFDPALCHLAARPGETPPAFWTEIGEFSEAMQTLLPFVRARPAAASPAVDIAQTGDHNVQLKNLNGGHYLLLSSISSVPEDVGLSFENGRIPFRLEPLVLGTDQVDPAQPPVCPISPGTVLPYPSTRITVPSPASEPRMFRVHLASASDGREFQPSTTSPSAAGAAIEVVAKAGGNFVIRRNAAVPIARFQVELNGPFLDETGTLQPANAGQPRTITFSTPEIRLSAPCTTDALFRLDQRGALQGQASGTQVKGREVRFTR